MSTLRRLARGIHDWCFVALVVLSRTVFWTLLLGLTMLVLYPCMSAAHAQTYVRPSKGAALTVFDNLTGSTQRTSAVYDWSAFESVQIIFTCSGCATEEIDVQGAPTASGTFAVLDDPNGARTSLTATISYTVSNTLPFIRFVYTAGSGTATYTLAVVPVPFAVRKEVSGGVATGTAGGTNYPVMVGGARGGASTGIPQVMNVDTSGRPVVVGAGTAGSPAGGVLTVQGVSSGTAVTVAGDVAHDGVDSGNPVKIGFNAQSGDPTAVAASDRANATSNLFGEIRTAAPVCAGTSVRVGTGTSTTSATGTTVNTTLYKITVRGVGAVCAWAATVTTTTLTTGGAWYPEGDVEYARASGTSFSCITIAGTGEVWLTPCSF